MSSTSPQGAATLPSPKQRLLDEYEREHQTTMRVLRAYPADKLDLRPHPKCRTAHELAWVFVMERGFATMVVEGRFGQEAPEAVPPPDSWDELLDSLEAAFQSFQDKIRGMSESDLLETVPFMAGKDRPMPIQRLQFLWVMLFDEIHHRGQFSIYLRMADGKVPSIYGPSGDQPWT